MADFGLFDNPIEARKELSRFFESGLSGADLARNPGLDGFLNVSNFLQRELDRLSRAATIAQGGTPETRFGLTTAANQFDLAQRSLRGEFVNAEIERQFGPQGVTSVSSTVGPDGVRRPVAGQRASTTPTDAQRQRIEAGFRTPLQRILAGGRAGAAAPSAPSQPRQPTIVSGGGIQRKRATGAPKPTILTSDADTAIGGQTLLG